MSLYKRGPYWHYEFMVSGRRYRGSTKQATRAKAEKVQAVKMAEAQTGNLPIVKRVPTLGELKPKFFQWVDDARLKPHSKRYYREGWKIIESTTLAKLKLDQITNDSLDAAKLPAKSDSSINQAVRTLSRMLHKSEEWRLIVRAPRLHLQPTTHREAIISREQESELLKHMGAKMRVAYLMMKDGGMRRDEVARARIEQIDWNEKQYFVADGKTPKSRRYVLLGKRLFEALFVHVGNRKEGWLFATKKGKTGHVHPDSLTHWFEKARADAKLPAKIVLYSARHTYGTVVFGQTKDLKLVMETMGHTSAKVAMIYQHPDRELGRQAIDAHNEAPARVM